MKKFVKNHLELLINVILLLLIAVNAYSWMLTEASHGELVDYQKHFVITTSDITVRLYVLNNNEYVEQAQIPGQPLISTNLLEPGKNQKYRFDITNANPVEATTKIIFTYLTGDILLLQNAVIFNETNPDIQTFRLGDRLEHDINADRYSFEFLEEFRIPANTTKSLYWNVEIDRYATSEIENSELNIGTIMFIKP